MIFKQFRTGNSWVVLAAAVIVIAVIIIAIFLTGCGKRSYKVDYCGMKEFYSNAKDTYKAGEEVELIFDLVASDTDYNFYLDGKSEGLDVHGTGNSFIIRFTMPDHDIKLDYSEKNSMEYQPDGKADFRF